MSCEYWISIFDRRHPRYVYGYPRDVTSNSFSSNLTVKVPVRSSFRWLFQLTGNSHEMGWIKCPRSSSWVVATELRRKLDVSIVFLRRTGTPVALTRDQHNRRIYRRTEVGPTLSTLAIDPQCTLRLCDKVGTSIFLGPLRCFFVPGQLNTIVPLRQTLCKISLASLKFILISGVSFLSQVSQHRLRFLSKHEIRNSSPSPPWPSPSSSSESVAFSRSHPSLRLPSELSVFHQLQSLPCCNAAVSQFGRSTGSS